MTTVEPNTLRVSRPRGPWRTELVYWLKVASLALVPASAIAGVLWKLATTDLQTATAAEKQRTQVIGVAKQMDEELEERVTTKLEGELDKERALAAQRQEAIKDRLEELAGGQREMVRLLLRQQRGER